MTLGFNIKGIDCSKNKIMVWNGKEVRVYEITGNSFLSCLIYLWFSPEKSKFRRII